MLLDIAKIKVGDRIREDFGNIDKLAENIKEHGLINPIAVTPQYELIAGERRLRALKKLGYKQVEVNVIAVEDAEQQLRLEISENTARKNFTPEEILIYGRRLERIESARANERKLSGLKQNATVKEDIPYRENAQTRDIVASELNISGRQYDNIKKIDANKDSFSPEDYENWKNGEKSTNSMLEKLKAQKDAEKQRADTAEARLRQAEAENAELRNRKPEVVERVVEKKVEVESEFSKRRLESLEKENKKLISERQEFVDKWKKSEQERKALEDEMKKPENERAEKIKTSALFFCAGVSNFIEKYGGYVWLADSLNEMEKSERDGYLKAVNALEGWVYQMKQNMKGE